MAAGGEGKVVQVIGTVVDVEFPPDQLPGIFNALDIDLAGTKLVLEVEQQVGNSWVRCLALGPTEGLARGAVAKDTGEAIVVPVGEPSLGRLFNVTGDVLDDLGAIDAKGVLADTPRASGLRRAEHDNRGARDRRQGA